MQVMRSKTAEIASAYSELTNCTPVCEVINECESVRQAVLA